MKGLQAISLRDYSIAGPRLNSEKNTNSKYQCEGDPEDVQQWSEPDNTCVLDKPKAQQPERKRSSAEQVIQRGGQAPRNSTQSNGDKVVKSYAFEKIVNFLEASEAIKLQQLNENAYRMALPRSVPEVKIAIRKFENWGVYHGEYDIELKERKNKIYPKGQGILKFSDTTASHGIESIRGEFNYFERKGRLYWDVATQTFQNRRFLPNLICVDECELKTTSGKLVKVPELALLDVPFAPALHSGIPSGFISLPISTVDRHFGQFEWKNALEILEKRSRAAERPQANWRGFIHQLLLCFRGQNNRNPQR